MKQVLAALFSLLLFAGSAHAEEAKSQPKIGLSFSDFAIERWPRERDEMTKMLKKAGFSVISQEANHDAKLQNDQIKNMAIQGAKVLIVVAEDGDAAATAVEEVARKGVKVIAYDRLIKTPKVAAYISFDNVEVGRSQARGILAVKNAGNFVLLGGSPADNNAHLFRKGQMEVLNPLIQAGKIKVVADQWVENWDPANAKKVMENILTATGKKFDAVVASNDGTALGALSALKAVGMAGKVPISGQDATEAGCNSIARGELTLSILKDTRKLTPLATDLAIKLAKGQKDLGLSKFMLADLTGDKNRKGDVACKFLPVSTVTKANLKQLVVDTGFQSMKGVYKDVPNAPAK